MTLRSMRGILTSGFILALTAVPIHSATVMAAEGDQVGETQMCVPLQQIGDRRVIDDRTILLKMIVGPSYKRIDLARDCRGLKAEGGFVSATSISKLCRQDILRVTQEAVGSQCIIDQIVTIDEAEAKALIEKRKNDRKNRE